MDNNFGEDELVEIETISEYMKREGDIPEKQSKFMLKLLKEYIIDIIMKGAAEVPIDGIAKINIKDHTRTLHNIHNGTSVQKNCTVATIKLSKEIKDAAKSSLK